MVYVIVRTFSAGVHCGELERHKGKEVVLRNTRRIWQWAGARTLSEMAVSGLDTANSKVSVELDKNTLTEAIEIIPCTAKAEKCLRAAQWK